MTPGATIASIVSIAGLLAIIMALLLIRNILLENKPRKRKATPKRKTK